MMETMVILLVLLVWVAGLLVYLRSLNRVFAIAKENDSAIFGKLYDSLSAMGSDACFLNNLWSGREIQNHDNSVLTTALVRARKCLIFQLVLSLCLFLLLILRAILQA